nr:eukaryotic translation initiation factor 4E type 1B isoform X2 [Caretta caretta]
MHWQPPAGGRQGLSLSAIGRAPIATASGLPQPSRHLLPCGPGLGISPLCQQILLHLPVTLPGGTKSLPAEKAGRAGVRPRGGLAAPAPQAAGPLRVWVPHKRSSAGGGSYSGKMAAAEMGGALHRREDQRRRKAQREALAAEIWDKHPLQNRWALWFFKNDKSKTWQANLRLVTKFSTAEDFWALYSHIQLASKLTSGCDYSLFKDGIEPMWEDNRNKRGGRWLITLAKQQRHTELDRFWLETLLCLIGETFGPYSEDICGAVINIRAKGDKIAIWTREAENRDGVTHIGRVYKERLGLSHKVVIGYQAHADTATKSGSLTKNKFVVGLAVGPMDPTTGTSISTSSGWTRTPAGSTVGCRSPAAFRTLRLQFESRVSRSCCVRLSLGPV